MRIQSISFFQHSLAVTAAVLALGCGGSEGDKTAPFVGTWAVATSSVTAMCPAPIGMVTQNFDKGQQEIKKGTDSDLIFSLFPDCQLKLNVSGSTATLLASPPQTCMLSFNGIPVMGTFTSGTLMVNGIMATYNYAGMAVIAGSVTCPVTGTGTAVKGAAADGGAPAADAGSTAADSGSSTD